MATSIDQGRIAKTPEREIPRELEALAQTINALGQTLDSLRQRLAPILGASPDNTETQKDPHAPVVTEVGSTIAKQTELIRRLDASITDVIAALEV